MNGADEQWIVSSRLRFGMWELTSASSRQPSSPLLVNGPRLSRCFSVPLVSCQDLDDEQRLPPAYVLCFIATLTTAYLSDKYKRRGFFLMGWSVVCVVGYSILISVSPKENPGVQYFALFLTVTSTGPLIACTISWTANTWAHHCEWLSELRRTALTADKKAIGMGLVFSSGNSGGIVASQAYRNKDAPRYVLIPSLRRIEASGMMRAALILGSSPDTLSPSPLRQCAGLPPPSSTLR